MFIIRGGDFSVDVISTEGTWIGITDDIEGFMKDVEVPVSKGDMILLYTDGATEAKNHNDEMFGEDRLAGSFRAHSCLPVNEIVQKIIADITEFQAVQDDDITLLVIKKIF